MTSNIPLNLLPAETLTVFTKNQVVYYNVPAYRYATPPYTLATSLAMWIGVGAMVFLLRSHRASLVPAVYFASFFLMLVGTATSVGLHGFLTYSYSSVYVWLGTTAALSMLLVLMRFLVPRFVMLGRNLLVLYRNGPDDHARIDYGATMSLAFFISTLAATLLWYGYVYDPSGTSVPVWTGVFG